MGFQPAIFLSFEVKQTLRAVGQLLRQARLLRGDTEAQVAARMNLSRATWRRIEQGDTSVRIGTFLQALVMFQMKDRVLGLAEEDPLADALLRRQLPQRGGRKGTRKPTETLHADA